MTNKEIINQINHKLDKLTKSHGKHVFEKELKKLQRTMAHANKLIASGKTRDANAALFIVIEGLKNVAEYINTEIKSFEKEAHGVANYSADINTRLNQLKSKIEFRNGIYELLQLVHAKRPALTEELI